MGLQPLGMDPTLVSEMIGGENRKGRQVHQPMSLDMEPILVSERDTGLGY